MDLKNRNNSLPGWSPDRILWKSLSNLTEDLNWKKVSLDLASAIHVPDDSRGAYLIAAAPPATGLERVGAYTVLYVGSVAHGNLRARFKQHVRYPADVLRQFRTCYYRSIHFWFTRVQNVRRIQELESLLKRAFNPPCNLIDPPGTAVLMATISEGVPLSRRTHVSP